MSEFLFGARELLAHFREKLRIERLPETAIICFSPSIAAQLAKKRMWPIESFFGAKWAMVPDSIVVVSGFGIGAPAAAAKVEEMKELGVRRILFIGTAGALQSNLYPGDVVIGAEALSAEGTSKHYSDKQRFAADEKLLRETQSLLRAKGLASLTGTVWSTDAPYRERRSELLRLQNQGVLAVDMEASAIYAVSRALGIQAVGIFVISDLLADNRWQPRFGHAEVRDSLSKVVTVVSQAFR